MRGERDDNVLGIRISDDVTKVQIHDNTFSGLGVAIRSERVFGRVGKVVDSRTFYREENRMASSNKPMLLRRRSHCYRNWRIRWLSDNSESVIELFDAEALAFTLKEDREIKVGDEFFIYSTVSAPWNIHDNIIDDCKCSIDLETEVGKRAKVRNNIINN